MALRHTPQLSSGASEQQVRVCQQHHLYDHQLHRPTDAVLIGALVQGISRVEELP